LNIRRTIQPFRRNEHFPSLTVSGAQRNQNPETVHSLARIFTLLGTWLGLAAAVHAQDGLWDSRGREFWMGFQKNASGSAQLSLRIAATVNTTGTVEVPLAGWSSAFTVTANGVVTLSVPLAYECSGSEVIQDRGVRITSQHPVTVTAVNYQTNTTDALQVFPMNALRTDYLVDAAPGTPPPYSFRSQFVIVATEDGTEVEITPSVNTAGGNPAGVPFTVNLNAGQTFQVQALSGNLDLSGSRVTGTPESGECRPFAVFGGSACAVVSCSACDHVCEQMAPVSAWGTSFHTIPVGSISSWSYRILARDNATSVVIDGGAPIVLNAGQYHQVLNATQPACITADKPISTTQTLQGQTCSAYGDPSLLVLTPDDRPSTTALFTTLTTNQASYAHLISVLVPTTAASLVTLDGAPVAASLFAAYPACPSWSVAKVPVTTGTHAVSCPAGLVAYAYGYGIGESYLYALSNRMTVPPPPPDSLICASGSVTLAPPVPLTNVTWTTSSDPNTVLSTNNAYTFTPDHNDTYIVNGSLFPSGCPRHYEFQVGVPVDTALGLMANGEASLTICQGDPVQLSTGASMEPPVFNLQWAPSGLVSDQGISDPVAYPVADTWFSLDVTSPVGCGAIKDSILVHVLASNVRSVRTTVDDGQICSGDPAQLHAQAEAVALLDAFEIPAPANWASILGGVADDLCGSVSGQALYFNAAGQRAATTAVMDLSAGGRARFSLKIAAGTAPCDNADPGEDVVLESSTNGSTWSLVATFNEAAYPDFTSITLSIPPLGANAQLRWRQLTNSGAGQDNWSLDNVEVTRYMDPASGLLWAPAASLSSATSATPTATPTADTWYVATITTPSGCTYADSVEVLVAPAFSLAPMEDTASCGAPGVQLQATALSGGVPANSGVTWSWTPAAGLNATNVANPMASPATTTNYTVTAANAIGCSDSETIQVVASGLASVSVSASEPSLCHGEQTQLSATVVASGPYLLAWSPAASVNAPDAASTAAAPGDTTTFTCSVTDLASGCSISGSVTVDVVPAFTTQLTADTTLCTVAGLQLQLTHDVPAPFQIQWSNAAFLSSGSVEDPVIQTDTSATYVVTITGPVGCTAQDSVHVAVAFDNLITPVNVSGCIGDTLLLDAGFPGSTYSWTTGSDQQVIPVDSSGTFTATITDSQLCQAVRTFVVDISPPPAVDLGPDQALCGVDELWLNAGSPTNNYLWSTGAQVHQIAIQATGTYSVAVTSPAGCWAADTVHLSLNPLPVDVLQDVIACIDAPPLLDAGNPGSTYLWSTGDLCQTLLPDTSGNYSVTIATPQQCTATFDAHVTLMPLVQVSLGNDTALCEGLPLVLDAGNAGNTVTWSTGDTGTAISPAGSGSYSVLVTNGQCSATDTVVVDFLPLPTITLTNDTACTGDLATFHALTDAVTYAWTTGATSPWITVAAPGTYGVTVTGSNGCAAQAHANAFFVPPPQVDLGPDTALCAGEQLILDAANPGSTWTWSTGAQVPAVAVGTSGTWSVAVDNGHCSVTDSIRVLFNPLPDRLGKHDFPVCLDEEPRYVLIDAGNPGSSFVWSSGQHTAAIHATDYGWYAVTITNVFGCSITDQVQVTETCKPTVYIPNTFTPDGDGINETWGPAGNNILDFQVDVFDRWGQLVFHGSSPDQAWDGSFNGEPVKNDMYAYRAVYRLQEEGAGKPGFEHVVLGHVQVLR
jgi:gliding motility-associated-like protein